MVRLLFFKVLPFRSACGFFMREITSGIFFQIDFKRKKEKQKEINNNKGKWKGKVKQRDYKEKWNQKKEKKI